MLPVASTRNSLFPAEYSARWIEIVSVATVVGVWVLVGEGIAVEVCVAVEARGRVAVAEGRTAVGAAVGVRVGVAEGGVDPPDPLWVTRTAIQSREKSRDVELAMLMTRTRKFASAKFAGLQVRPHVSVGLPRINVFILVPRVAVDLAAVQVAPPSEESCTHILGELAVLSARASRRTSIPVMVAPAGIENP